MTYYCIIVNLSNYAILLYDVGSLRLTPIMCAQTLAVVEFISNSLISLYDGALAIQASTLGINYYIAS